MTTFLSTLLIPLLLGGAPMTPTPEPALETASFGGGCFWCLEPFFEQLKGVNSVVSGYQGGTTPHPTYQEVSSGKTGHAEVVRITYDPAVIDYRQLVEVFFQIHDPTTLNRQGHDVGTQYRSVIFYHNPTQKQIAEDVLRDLTEQKLFSDPIVTTLESAGPFHLAEAYHQDFYRNNPGHSYCRLVIAPKLRKIKLPDDLKKP